MSQATIGAEGGRRPKMHSLRSKVPALWLVGGMALLSGSLRFALWSADELTLLYLYGAATVKHDHLRMLRTKPLSVSNGDVLRGIGAYHYYVGVGIWIPVVFVLALLIDRVLLPEPCRAIVNQRHNSQDHASAGAILVVLPMVVLITAVLPTWVALVLAFVTLSAIVVVLRKIPYGDAVLR
jgi:hypothetical protein